MGFRSQVSLVYYISHITDIIKALEPWLLSYYFLFKECVFVHYFILCINFSFFCLTFKVLKEIILSQAHVLQIHSSLLSNPPVTHGSHRSYMGYSHTHAVPFLECSLSPAMPVYSACPLKQSHLPFSLNPFYFLPLSISQFSSSCFTYYMHKG